MFFSSYALSFNVNKFYSVILFSKLLIKILMQLEIESIFIFNLFKYSLIIN